MKYRNSNQKGFIPLLIVILIIVVVVIYLVYLRVHKAK